MAQSRINWFAYAVLVAGLAACGSSKSSDESEKSSPAAESGESSDSDAGPAESSGPTKNGKFDAGSSSGSKSGDTKSAGGSGGKGGTGGAAASGGKGGEQSQPSTRELPSDGNQLSLCSMAQGDCNKGLACSGSASPLAESRDYCSKICETDEDCAGVAPSSAKYTCSTGGGTKHCEIACSGSDDSSCPENMKCLQTGVTRERRDGSGGSGGSGGGASEPRAGAGGNRGNSIVPVYHCKYPLIASPVWGPCQDGEHQCEEDATCHGSGAGRPGVCTKSCTMDSDCSEKPSSGSITPSCATITEARGNMPETKLCVLSCLDKKDGCPEGTTCVEGPRASMGRGMPMGRGRGQNTANADAGSASEPAYARCE